MARLASRDMTAPAEERRAKKHKKMESAEEKNQEKKQKKNFLGERGFGWAGLAVSNWLVADGTDNQYSFIDCP